MLSRAAVALILMVPPASPSLWASGAPEDRGAGAIPAVGGYSSFLTVGIVTQVEGQAFVVPAAAGKADSSVSALSVGQGLSSGDRLWLEHGALIRIADTQGGRIAIAGQALVELARGGRAAAIRVDRGSVKLSAAEGRPIRFETTVVAGSVEGEGALWVARDAAQVLGLSGDVKVWHPRLPAAAVLVTPGAFSEASSKFNHLQPTRAVAADIPALQAFLGRFDEVAPSLAEQGPSSPRREPAAHVMGSRDAAEILEPKSPQSVSRLMAHLTGRDFREEEGEAANAPLVATANRRPAGNGRGKPGYQVVLKGKRLDSEAQQLLDGLERKPAK